MTLKKQRQKMAIKFRKVLGISFSTAKKLAKFNIDGKGQRKEIELALTECLGAATFYKGCECCGDSRYTWTGKAGTIKLEYGVFAVV